MSDVDKVETVDGKTKITQELWIEDYFGVIRLNVMNLNPIEGHTTLRPVTVEVIVDDMDFVAIRDAKIEALKTRMEKARADATRVEDTCKREIQKLMCLESS